MQNSSTIKKVQYKNALDLKKQVKKAKYLNRENDATSKDSF